MGTGLITYGDALLEVGGALADDLDCCCDDCPPCCARITNGALIDGAIHLFIAGAEYSMEVVITTPSGDRFVCKDDVVQFEFTLVPNGEDPIPSDLYRDAFITWDPAWKYVGHSPEVSGADGWFYELGFILWGDVAANTYAASLKYFPCFNDPNPGIGAVNIGFAELDIETFVEGNPCPDQSCCDVDPVCAPCCYTLDGGVWDEEKGAYVFVVEGDTYSLIVEVNLPDNANKRICPGEEVNVKIRAATRLLPLFANSPLDVGAIFEGVIHPVGDASPAPTSESSTFILWESSPFPTVHTFSAELPCEFTGDPAQIGITAGLNVAWEGGGTDSVELWLNFNRCETPLETDCCNYVCENCCSNIEGGVIQDGVIRFFLANDDYSMEVEILTESGTRLVCDGEIITIAITFTGPTPYEPYASWDPVWEYAGHLPGEDPATGFFDENGLVEWGQLESSEYTLLLEYSPCLLAENPALGLIRIGSHAATDMAFDFAVDIELQHCDMVDCCEIESVCEPCCWELIGGVYDEDTGVFRYYAEAANFWVVVEVSIPQPTKRLTCADDSVSVNVKIGSRDRETLESHTFNVEVAFDGWGYASASPAPPTTEPVVGEPGTVTWATNPSHSYSVNLDARCGVREPGGITVIVSDTIAFTQIGAIGVGFVKCLTSADCNCCCAHCCAECHFPVTEGICEQPGPPLHEDGGPTQIVNFVTNVTASSPVFCDGTTDTTEISQNGESRHYISCNPKCLDDLSQGYCASSACNFDVPLENDCPPEDGYGTFGVKVFYGSAGWAITSGGVGYIYWITGRTSYSGDCTGATASGTFALAGVTYNWTTTFTVQRSGSDPFDCPIEEEEGGGEA
ncbi:MAG: hypothetical protein ACO1RT_20415 [Planctomycetaceae bacterium]